MNSGWVVDQTLALGHLEAALSHIDDQIFKAPEENLQFLLTQRDAVYAARRELEATIFEAAVNDENWCLLKHLATAYVMTSEAVHSRGKNAPTMPFEHLNKALASTLSATFGVRVDGCLRCIDEKIKLKEYKEEVTNAQ